MNTEVLANIFTKNLAVKEDERVLVFTDIPAHDDCNYECDEESSKAGELAEIAETVAEIGLEFCRVRYQVYESIGAHGAEPPVEIWESAFGEEAIGEIKEAGLLEKLLNKELTDEDTKKCTAIIDRYKDNGVDCVIALSKYSTSHTNFRKWLTKWTGTRYASMPLFEKSMIDGVMTADWDEIKLRTSHIARALRGADSVIVSTPKGTHLSFSIRGRQVLTDDGLITKKGSFSNLPAGEAFLAPLEGTATGKLVLEWAPTRKLKSPITLKVSKGKVVEVIGDEPYADTIRAAIEKNQKAANIAELGVGTNDMAKRPDNILETEKIFGTVHIAIGDNSTFGGTVKVPYHQDFIFFGPTLEAVRAGNKFLLIEDGFPLF